MAPITPIAVASKSKETNAKIHNTNHNTTQKAIPNILIFTHYKKLLQEDQQQQQQNYLDQEEQVLAANIRKSIALHPEVESVRFLTDEDCIQSLAVVFPSLIPFFQNESQGMYKADICRGSALYETGGIYLDVDVGVRHNLWAGLLAETEFVTAKVHKQSKYPNHFFQAIVGTTPESPILKEYLQLFEDYYLGIEQVHGPLGVILLRRAFDRIIHDESSSAVEITARTPPPAFELWQEVLYSPKYFPNLEPAPIWGTRRACHFVVVAHAHASQQPELWLHDQTTARVPVGMHIPLYSRVAGSRMCPINTTTSAGTLTTKL
jgi:hypothetical protein